MSKNLENDIKSLLIPKQEREKKQVALFLNPKKIDQLDGYVRELSQYSNGRVNRNILIEKAVDNLLDTLPRIIKECEKNDREPEDAGYNLIVCASQESGLNFIEKNNKWQYVKVDANKIPNIKYLALYVGAPVSAICLYVEVDEFIEEIMPDKQKKYTVTFKSPIHYISPIKLGDLNPITTRGIKYTTLDRLLKAKEYSDILS